LNGEPGPEVCFEPVSPLRAGLRACCPRCGQGPLFQGFLTVRPSCPACGLDYAGVDSGDGPAAFIILILGIVVVGLALFVEVRYEPPYWVHAALWLPLILAGGLGFLRPLKAAMIAQAYRHGATQDVELQ